MTTSSKPVAEGRPSHAALCKCAACHRYRARLRGTDHLLLAPKTGKLAIDSMPLPLRPPGGRP